MSACPGCGQEVRPLWPTCRSCGALLMAAPAPVVPIGTEVAPVVDDQFFAPAVLRPITQLPPTPSPSYPVSTRKKVIAAIGVAAFVVAAGTTAWFTFLPGAASAQHETPVALTPRAPTEGLPTSLSVIVRVEAESTRHTALQTIEAAGTADLSTLTTNQPNYQWIAGNQPSTSPKVVSVAQNGKQVTIAVDASSHDVCAFGQWSPDATPMYVTMAHQPTCAAIDAPSTGWSNQPGGAASDLPDDSDAG